MFAEHAFYVINYLENKVKFPAHMKIYEVIETLNLILFWIKNFLRKIIAL